MAGSLLALTEERATNPDVGRSFFDSDLKIVGHPHREIKRMTYISLCQEPVRDPSCPVKDRANQIALRIPGGHRHQPHDRQAGQFGRLPDHSTQAVALCCIVLPIDEVKAMFGRFPGDINLDE